MQKLFVDPSYADTTAHRPPAPRLQPARCQLAASPQDLRLAICPNAQRASYGHIAGSATRAIGHCLLLTVSNKTWVVWAMPKQAQLALLAFRYSEASLYRRAKALARVRIWGIACGIACAGAWGALGRLGHSFSSHSALHTHLHIHSNTNTISI